MIHQCGVAMSYGKYTEARTRLKEIFTRNHVGRVITWPKYYEFRALTIAGISAQAQASFAEVVQSLRRQKYLADKSGSLSLPVLVKRRELSYFLGTENYDAARQLGFELHPENFSELLSPTMLIILIQEHIKLHLAISDLESVQKYMTMLQEAVQRNRPHETAVVPIEENCEMSLFFEKMQTNRLVLLSQFLVVPLPPVPLMVKSWLPSIYPAPDF